MSLEQYLGDQGFRSILLELSTEGAYDWKDSEWNYSDIPHLKHIHSQVESYSLGYDRNQIHNIFIQSFMGISLPAMVSIYHYDSREHRYYMQIANIVIEVKTVHLSVAANRTRTTTRYKFYFRGLVGYLVGRLARFATRRNYKVLMSEDIPMRLKRGRLRSLGYGFKSDVAEMIGFSDTTDIENDNMVIRKVGKAVSDGMEFEIEDDDKGGWSIESEECQLGCTVDNSSIVLRYLSCPHEGGDLCRENSLRKEADSRHRCKWHGRRVRELCRFNRGKESFYSFKCFGLEWEARITRLTNSEMGRDRVLIRPKNPDSE